MISSVVAALSAQGGLPIPERRSCPVSAPVLSTTSSYCLQFSDEETKAQSGWSPRSHGQEAVEPKTSPPQGRLESWGIIPLGLSSWAPITMFLLLQLCFFCNCGLITLVYLSFLMCSHLQGPGWSQRDSFPTVSRSQLQPRVKCPHLDSDFSSICGNSSRRGIRFYRECRPSVCEMLGQLEDPQADFPPLPDLALFPMLPGGKGFALGQKFLAWESPRPSKLNMKVLYL